MSRWISCSLLKISYLTVMNRIYQRPMKTLRRWNLITLTWKNQNKHGVTRTVLSSLTHHVLKAVATAVFIEQLLAVYPLLTWPCACSTHHLWFLRADKSPLKNSWSYWRALRNLDSLNYCVASTLWQSAAAIYGQGMTCRMTVSKNCVIKIFFSCLRQLLLYSARYSCSFAKVATTAQLEQLEKKLAASDQDIKFFLLQHFTQRTVSHF